MRNIICILLIAILSFPCHSADSFSKKDGKDGKGKDKSGTNVPAHLR